MDIDQKRNFTLNYHRLKFPLRLLCASLLGLGATALILGQVPRLEVLWTTLSAVTLITLVIWALQSQLEKLDTSNGVILAWFTGALVMISGYWVLSSANILTLAPMLESDQFFGGPAHIDKEYLWVLGLFVLPIALTYEQLMHIRDQLHDSAVKSALSDLDFRIRPHFLFNSLNSIATLIHQDPVRAEDGLMDLADMFRTIMTDKRSLVPLSSELSIAKKYVSLEKMRLGDRLEVEWSLQGLDENALLPMLTLQPLLENAIYHGIETRLRGGTVVIKSRQSADYVFISIINPKPEIKKPVRKGNQLAQKNLIDRFNYYYSGEGSLQLVETDSFFTMTIKFPRVLK